MLIRISMNRAARCAFVVVKLAYVFALAGASALAQTNPQVPVGGSGTFPILVGVTQAKVEKLWEISLNNVNIASPKVPNGWSFTVNNALVTITAPSGAAVGNYQANTATFTNPYPHPAPIPLAYYSIPFQVVTGPIQPVLGVVVNWPPNITSSLVPAGTQGTLQVYFNQPTNSNATVTLTTSDSTAAPIPAQTTINQGNSIASVNFTVGYPAKSENVTIKATYNSMTVSTYPSNFTRYTLRSALPKKQS